MVVNYWSWFAILASLFWGVYGCKEESKEFWKKEFQKKTGWDKWIKPFGIFFSEFIGSFAGWCCFYILTHHLKIVYPKIESVDIWLIIGAVVGMTGYSHRIVNLITKTDANHETRESVVPRH